MVEDRLRALRAIRFAGRFGFEIDKSTWAAIRDSAPHLRRLSPERVRQELEKTMEQVVAPGWAIERWQTSGAMGVLIPDLAGAPAVARAALDHLPRPGPPSRPDRVINRLTALFLPVPAGRIASVLRDLRFSNSDAKWIGELASRWRDLDEEMSDAVARAEPPGARTARRWAARAGRTRVRALLRIAHAVWSARRAAGLPAPSSRQVRAADRAIVRALFDPIEIADLAVDGEDLAAAGIPPGPEVGKILRALLDLVLDEPARNTREDLLATARVLSRPTAPEE
jgi:tRNA nucleotidyltransferase/poly(A) polymerase